ncbi:MAG TPA: polysaccharide deacetylase family protein [Solirubrobacteraceae bacterium]|jgi:peptidoglycan/xylan/chitin deacetylase (PgdA/CDA1 family)
MRPPLILAYHGLGRYPRALDPFNLMLAPERFRWQLRSLSRRRYRFIRLSQLARMLDDGPPSDRVCALTFDDGTVDNLQVLAPILAEFDAPATVFACPGLLGSRHFAMPEAADVRLMDAEQLVELASSPLVEIGSHTNLHTDLSTATADEAHHEMASSKAALEELLQQPVESFAYPKCRYSPVCPDAARRAGYALAVTCAGLGGWRRFELARESIDALDRKVTFALKSRGLFLPLRNSALGRVATAAARPLRHRGAA